MSKKTAETEFIAKIRQELDDSVDEIDAATLSRITQARHRALDQKTEARQGVNWWTLTAMASACVALVVLSLVQSPEVEEHGPIEDYELISNIDDLEMLEDLEFYEWLEEYELPT